MCNVYIRSRRPWVFDLKTYSVVFSLGVLFRVHGIERNRMRMKMK
jgi:hypothetical protein